MSDLAEDPDNCILADPPFEAGPAHCAIKLGTFDATEFEAHFGRPPNEVTAKDLRERFIFPFFDEASLGASLTALRINRNVPGEMRLALEVNIKDPNLFMASVVAGGRANGRDHDWNPDTAAEAIFEAFCASNDSPSPVDMGFEILDWGPPEILTTEIKREVFRDGKAAGAVSGYVCDREASDWLTYLAEIGVWNEIVEAIQRGPASTIGVLRDLRVDANMRHQGIGTELLDHAMAEFQRLGAEATIVIADLQENIGFNLVSWYERRGFAVVDTADLAPLMMRASEDFLIAVRSAAGYEPPEAPSP